MKPLSDKDLTDRIAAGDESAFRELVVKYQKKVFHTCLGLLHYEADAEDITQEVFIEVYESIAGFRAESGLSTWIYRIAVNKSLNHLRSKKRSRWFRSIEAFFTPSEKNEALQLEGNQSDRADTPILENEKSTILHRAIDALPTNQRIAFVFSKFDDLSYKEIAEVMQVSISSVESLVHRAKINLQKKLLSFYKKN